MCEIAWGEFAELIKELIKFKAKTTKVPIRAESWEELSWAALAFMYGKTNVIWRHSSHKPSVDIQLKVDKKICNLALKASKINGNIITLSSYRLTRYETLQDKLNFIRKEHHQNINYYLLCARENLYDNIKYHVYKIRPEDLAPEPMLIARNWVETEREWYLDQDITTNIGFVSIKIIKKMSHQLWYAFRTDAPFLETLAVVIIPKNETGKGLIEFLKNKFRKIEFLRKIYSTNQI